jgi:hypothetical protein
MSCNLVSGRNPRQLIPRGRNYSRTAPAGFSSALPAVSLSARLPAAAVAIVAPCNAHNTALCYLHLRQGPCMWPSSLAALAALDWLRTVEGADFCQCKSVGMPWRCHDEVAGLLHVGCTPHEASHGVRHLERAACMLSLGPKCEQLLLAEMGVLLGRSNDGRKKTCRWCHGCWVQQVLLLRLRLLSWSHARTGRNRRWGAWACQRLCEVDIGGGRWEGNRRSTMLLVQWRLN